MKMESEGVGRAAAHEIHSTLEEGPILKELREARARFDKDVAEAKSFQDLIWRVQEEMYYRSLNDVAKLVDETNEKSPATSSNYEIKAKVKELKRGTKIIDDSDRMVDLGQLRDELNKIETEEEKGPEAQQTIRNIRPLFQRVLELRSNRAVLNSEYRTEHTLRVATHGQFIAIHAISTETVSRSNGVTDPTPIIIAPGFSVGPESIRRNAIGLAEQGRPVMTFEVPPNSVDFDEGPTYPKGTTNFTKVHANALLKTAEAGEKDIYPGATKYDVIGYSVGAVNALTAAMAEPEHFRNIILLNPAGLSDVESSYLKRFIYLVMRSAKHRDQVLHQVERAKEEDIRQLSFHNEFNKEMEEIQKTGGLSFAVKTADSITRTNLVPYIKALTEKGVKITILLAEEDPLFPRDTIENSAREAGALTVSAPGGHANLGFSPGYTSAACVELFKYMNAENSTIKT